MSKRLLIIFMILSIFFVILTTDYLFTIGFMAYTTLKNMKIKSIILVLSVLITAFSLQSCNSDESNSNTANIQLKLIDAEGDYDKVLVDILDVQYNRGDDEGGWVSFEGFSLPETEDSLNRVDLCELIAGNSLVLTDQEIEAGSLHQIRFILGENNGLVLDGEEDEIPLDTPSAQQSGLKLMLNEELAPGFSYTFILDWDVQKSIVKAGNSGKYNLKPVIRVIAEVNSGTIAGQVADILETEPNADPMPLENVAITAYAAADVGFGTPITTSYSNNEGEFKVQGLPEGSYILRVELANYITIDITDPTAVTVGNETVLEKIHLTQS